MFIRKSRHDAIVAGLEANIRALKNDTIEWFSKAEDECKAKEVYRADMERYRTLWLDARDEAAKYRRSVAPLMEANARRKREAAERKGEGN
ncbi:hypothetical protein [Sphingobium sp. CFD-1]|uniref:hypothetical protein n=1 Tax=Sphingobium sp. CFD-1 TaxID=2878545 RepID=UPI00214C0F9A|nr:hypothetical protein [Sphingobium sp. CFD-1]